MSFAARCQESVQSGFEYVPMFREYTSCLAKLFYCLITFAVYRGYIFFLFLGRIGCISIRAHCLLSFYWAPPGRLCLFFTKVFTHVHKISLILFLQTKHSQLSQLLFERQILCYVTQTVLVDSRQVPFNQLLGNRVLPKLCLKGLAI